MDELLEYVPEDKREEFKTKAAGYIKPTDDVLFDLVSKSQSLRDKVSAPQVEAFKRNYEEKKLPELKKTLTEEIRKEFAPKDETPEQKEIRELREWKIANEKKERDNTKKDALRKKAAELGYDPLKAEKLYQLENAEDVLIEFVNDFKSLKTKNEELENKIKYGGRPIPAAGGVDEITALKTTYVALMNQGRGEEATALYFRIKQLEGAKNG